jgi:hypothetical protein
MKNVKRSRKRKTTLVSMLIKNRKPKELKMPSVQRASRIFLERHYATKQVEEGNN